MFGSRRRKSEDEATAALGRAQEMLERVQTERASHVHGRPDGSDLPALVDWKRAAADLAIQEEAANEALEFAVSEQRLAAERAARARAEEQHRQTVKAAGEHARLTREIALAVELLAANLAKSERLRVAIESANAQAPDDLRVIDGETSFRHIPEKHEPAQYVTSRGWRHVQHGTAPRALTPDGRPLHNARFYELRDAREIATPARVRPGYNPKRFAETLQLVNVEGRQIWPLSGPVSPPGDAPRAYVVDPPSTNAPAAPSEAAGGRVITVGGVRPSHVS